MIRDIDKIFQERFEPTDQQLILDYSRGFIPFSNISESTKSKYIYIGTENIPFNERHPKYQALFIQEFLTYKKNLVKCFS